MVLVSFLRYKDEVCVAMGSKLHLGVGGFGLQVVSRA